MDAVGVVIATADAVTDLAASAFASKFYSAIAESQPLQSALEQGAVALDVLGFDEGWKVGEIHRPGLSLRDIVLIPRR